MTKEARDSPCSDCGGTGTIRGTQARYDEACEACRLRARVAYLEAQAKRPDSSCSS